MRFLLPLFLALGCGGPAEAGDLWLDVDSPGPEEIHLHLPANWLAEAQEPVLIDTPDGQLDLSAAARELKAQKLGATRSWALKDGDSVALSHVKLSGAPAETLAMATVGPKGNGMTITMELSPEQIGQAAANHLDGTLDVDGVKVELEKAMCDQLKASPGVVLVRTKGPKGGGIVVETK